MRYRRVNGEDAPTPGYVARSSVSSVPTKQENAQLLTYFTEPHIFGKEFRQMRIALDESVEAFTEEGDAVLPHLRGDLGLTAQFIGHVAPAQALLAAPVRFVWTRSRFIFRTMGQRVTSRVSECVTQRTTRGVSPMSYSKKCWVSIDRPK